MKKPFLLTFVTLAAAPLCIHAQWLNQPDPRTPRTKDGKPNLSAPAPRVHGKPDLSGVWQAESTPREILAHMFPPGVGLLPGGENGLGEDDPQKYFLDFLADYKPNEEPLTPAAAAELQRRMQSDRKPPTLCVPLSLPVSDLLPEPFKIVQTPGLTLILHETDSVFRQIYTDGRTVPADPIPGYLGYSVGRWEGDWFVVDATGFNDKSDLDAMGHPHSDAMRTTERFHRRDFGHIEEELTIVDPKTFTKPVTVRFNLRLLPDTDVMESFCTEGEQDQAHLPGK